MAIAPALEIFTRGHLITAAEWKAQVSDQFAASPPHVLTASGQLFYSGTSAREILPLSAPTGTATFGLSFSGNAPLWMTIAQMIAAVPSQSIARSKLAADAVLPAVSTEDAGKYVRVNSAGNGYENVDRNDATITRFVSTRRLSARPGYTTVGSVTGWEFGDRIIYGSLTAGTSNSIRLQRLTSSLAVWPISVAWTTLATSLSWDLQVRRNGTTMEFRVNPATSSRTAPIFVYEVFRLRFT